MQCFIFRELYIAYFYISWIVHFLPLYSMDYTLYALYSMNYTMQCFIFLELYIACFSISWIVHFLPLYSMDYTLYVLFSMNCAMQCFIFRELFTLFFIFHKFYTGFFKSKVCLIGRSNCTFSVGTCPGGERHGSYCKILQMQKCWPKIGCACASNQI